MNKIILFNPKSGVYNHRIPNSILQVAASIHGKYEYVIVDGNMERDAWGKLKSFLDTGEFNFFGSTVMPGPQLNQAITFTKRIKLEYPEVINIWGGYFPSNQYSCSIKSGYVDYIINGPGDVAFPELIYNIENHLDTDKINNLIFLKDGKIIKTPKAPLLEQDLLPELPYDYMDTFYPIAKYMGKTFLGEKTFAYHSSIGCPFTCSFCGVVPIYEARWKGKSASRMYREIKYVRDKYGADAIEFHDNNFFVSEKRVIEFCKLIKKEKMHWWGESRIDTMDLYSDDTLKLLYDAGCRMIFYGAESGSDVLLSKMEKGGKQTGKQLVSFAARIKKFGIIPEYSFVLGFPADTPEMVMKQIDNEIQFIKKVKEVNPSTEIIIYIYSPVPTEGSELFTKAASLGFKFPQRLEDWLEPEWEKFDLHRNPLTPWITKKMVTKIHNFETVLNGYYPTVSDYKLTSLQREITKLLSSMRYRINLFSSPYEIKLLQRYWLKYRKPDVEGFYMQ
ncbi:MAG: B12-binding domain-containing radical SAM protein [Ignavibacteriaceae bacterium]